MPDDTIQILFPFHAYYRCPFQPCDFAAPSARLIAGHCLTHHSSGARKPVPKEPAEAPPLFDTRPYERPNH